MYRAKGNYRPNVISAKQSGYDTYGEKVDIITKKYRTSGHFRTTAIDLCDTCLKEIRIYKKGLYLRKKGWRNICFNCWFEKGKPDCKENKLLLEFKFKKQNDIPNT